MDTGDLPLKQRVADAMVEADKKTAHLHPGACGFASSTTRCGALRATPARPIGPGLRNVGSPASRGCTPVVFP
jgi:hypothetical protein